MLQPDRHKLTQRNNNNLYCVTQIGDLMFSRVVENILSIRKRCKSVHFEHTIICNTSIYLFSHTENVHISC